MGAFPSHPSADPLLLGVSKGVPAGLPLGVVPALNVLVGVGSI